MAYTPVPGQVSGHEKFEKQREEKCKVLLEKFNAPSEARKKAIEYVQMRKSKREEIEKWLNNNKNEKTDT